MSLTEHQVAPYHRHTMSCTRNDQVIEAHCVVRKSVYVLFRQAVHQRDVIANRTLDLQGKVFYNDVITQVPQLNLYPQMKSD